MQKKLFHRAIAIIPRETYMCHMCNNIYDTCVSTAWLLFIQQHIDS